MENGSLGRNTIRRWIRRKLFYRNGRWWVFMRQCQLWWRQKRDSFALYGAQLNSEPLRSVRRRHQKAVLSRQRAFCGAFEPLSVTQRVFQASDVSAGAGRNVVGAAFKRLYADWADRGICVGRSISEWVWWCAVSFRRMELGADAGVLWDSGQRHDSRVP